jgi:hypothetical protein
MKKGKCFMGIGFLMFLICLFHSGAIAGGFSFIGISWDDTPKQVLEKMTEDGLITERRANTILGDLKSQGCVGSFEHIMRTAMVDQEATAELRKKSLLPDGHDLEEFSNIKSMSMGCRNDSTVKKVEFYFSCDEKLLTYAIDLKGNFSGDEQETGEGQIYRSLVEKYGPPIPISEYSKKWTKDEQSLYYFFVDEQSVFLLYVSNRNIDRKLAEFQAKRDEVKKGSTAKEKEAVKKRF